MIQMLECLNLPQRFLSFSSLFWILVSSFCYGWLFISSFSLKSLIWVLVSFPSLFVSYISFFISLFVAFTSFFILWPYSTISVSILITSVLNSASDRLTISSLHSSFSGVLISFFIWAVFFVLVHLLCSKGPSFRYLPGWDKSLCYIVVLYVGEGSEREQCHLLGSHSAFSHFPRYSQVNSTLLVLIPGWVGLCTF